jgi:hypothetical protein
LLCSLFKVIFFETARDNKWVQSRGCRAKGHISIEREEEEDDEFSCRDDKGLNFLGGE